MRIRHLRIRVNTVKGLFGTDIKFPNGLVVLWADNSMGKSTCLKSILVVLGFESMLTTSQSDLPLPPVLKHEVTYNSQKFQVTGSNIFLEIENNDGKRIVIQRTVKGTRDKNLITVTYGPAISENSNSYETEDFFVSRPGSASREKGFHKFLADFLSWQLPLVPTYDGNMYPLYLQCIFPFITVEQTRGWASLNPPIPTHFRIREPHKRVVEFILNFDAINISKKRLEIEENGIEIKKNWSSVTNGLRIIAKSVNGVISSIPQHPMLSFKKDEIPIIQLPKDDNWINLDTIINNKKVELEKLVNEEIPKVNEISSNAESELAKNEESLRGKENILGQLLESFEMERSEVKNVKIRLSKIDEDLQRNKDVKTLFSLGSSSSMSVSKQICPTCHQNLEDSLAPVAKGQSVMSIDENINFLKEQKRTFSAVLNNTESIVMARERQVARLRTEIADIRSHIRSLRQTLISDARIPSVAAIQKRVKIQEEISNFESALEQYNSSINDLDDLTKKWNYIQNEKENLPKGDTSDKDIEKINSWTSNLRSQLVKYVFRSLSIEDLSISEDTYMPIHEGFVLPTNISASDFIRVIWAYLHGMLELSREFKTNHPGLLIFDEPKQQSTKDLSFAELLKRVSSANEYNNQVIFATSEDRIKLKQILRDVTHSYIEFEGRIIAPIE